MARMKLTENGPACPRCGSMSFQRRSALAWKPGQTECVGCGTILKPARITAVARHRARRNTRR